MTEVSADLLVGLREIFDIGFYHSPSSTSSLLHPPVDVAGRVVPSGEVIQTSTDKSDLFLPLI